MTSLFCSLTLPLFAGFAVAPTDVSLWHGPRQGPADVLVLDEASGLPRATQGLDGLRPRPIDFVGRTVLCELLPGAPRRRVDPESQHVHLALPGDHGSLYGFERELDGLHEFGFFRIDAQGVAQRVFARPAEGGADPFLPFVAVAPGGGAVLVATRGPAGGDVFEVDQDSGEVRELTAALPPLDVRPHGLWLLPRWGVILTEQGVLRFDRTERGPAAFATLAGASASWFGEGLVASADGGSVAFLAGAGPDLARVYGLRRAGAAHAISGAPARVADVGYLPFHEDGPFLALAPDGRACAWLEVGATSRELMVRQVGAGVPPPLHVTAPARFSNTLNDSGVIAFFAPAELFFVQGEGPANGQGPITRADLYCAEVGATGGLTTVELVNMTATSGDVTVPFEEYGWLPSGAGLRRTHGGRELLLHDAFHGVLQRVDLALEGVVAELHQVAALEALDVARSHVILSLRRTSGERELHRLRRSQRARIELLGRLPQGLEFEALVASRHGLAFGVELGSHRMLLGALDPETQRGGLFASDQDLESLGFAGLGSLLLGFEEHDGVRFFGVTPAGNLSMLGTFDDETYLLATD